MGVVQAEHRIGDIVAGRYQLTKVFAKGGMGWLWEAQDGKLKRKVAVKLLSKKFALDAAARQRFEREAMSVAKLSSAHIVQIFDYGIEGDTPYIVMELLVGEDLRRRLKAKKLLSLTEMYRIVAQIAAGLTEAHNAGVVHRDLKPANVFLAQTQTGEIVKLLDFGVAKPEGEPVDEEVITGEGAVVGTPQYMSPEQIRAYAIDHRSDLFSLGVIVYRCLVGRLPFEGKTVNDLQVNIATKEVPPPTEIADWLPDEVDTFMKRALGKTADARFQSARQMSDAFASLIPGSVPGLDAPSLSGALTASSASLPRVPPPPPSMGIVSQSSVPNPPTFPSITAVTAESSASMSNTAAAAILAAADAEMALQKKPPWGKRFGMIAAVLCVIALCIGIGTLLFGGGEPQAKETEPSATVVAPAEPAPPTPEPTVAEVPEPVESVKPAPEPPPKKKKITKKAKPAAVPPAQPPQLPPQPPADKPFDPFKNRK